MIKTLKSKLFLTLIAVFIFSAIVFAGSQQTSSTAASTIITYARYYLNESSADFWSDAELLAWINQGTMDIVSRTRCLESTETITLASSTVEYTISSSYIDISTVTYTDSDGNTKGLQKSNPQTIGHPRDTEPAFWYEWNGKVGIFPALSSRTTEVATAFYVSTPSALTATSDTIVVPAIYDRALTLYVAAQALLKEEQYGKSARLMGEYLAEIDRFRTDFVDRPKEPESNVTR